MANVKKFKFFGVLIAILLVLMAVYPFINGQTITNDTIASSIIFLLIAVGYIIVLVVPRWLKAILFFEGIIIAVTGYIFLAIPYNICFIVIGIAVILLSILAYRQKLPDSVLRLFYRN